MNQIAWPLLLLGLGIAAVAGLLMARALRAWRTSATGGHWSALVAVLLFALVAIAGLLLVFWALNLRGTLGH